MNTKELKDKILQLAITGKLVEQDENDTPAKVLLEQIKLEKERLIREKKIKKEKALSEITDEEKAFELPKGWEWCRVGDIGIYKKGPFGSTITKNIFVPQSENTIKVYEQKNAIKKDWTLGEYYVTKEYFEEKLKFFEVFEDDIIVSCAGTIGETYIMPKGIQKGIINQALMRMKIFCNIDIKYFLLYFDFILKRETNQSSKGSAIKNIPPFSIFKNMLCPLPPLEEQKRIVQKVDELFTLIDQLEGNKQELLEGIKKSREKVLQLAIEGKLVKQDENDTPASILLQEIKIEKERLIKEKKIKKEKPLPEITDEEKSFELPKGWCFSKLGNLSEKIHYGYTASSQIEDSGVKLLRITDIQNNSVEWETVPFCLIEKSKLQTSVLENNDILIARTGGTIGKSFIVKNVECVAVFASYLIRIKSLKGIYPDYIKKFLESQFYWEQLANKTQGTGQPNVNAVSLSNLIVPIPTLEEQKRIVEKVDELMKYFDTLEKEICS